MVLLSGVTSGALYMSPRLLLSRLLLRCTIALCDGISGKEH